MSTPYTLAEKTRMAGEEQVGDYLRNLYAILIRYELSWRQPYLSACEWNLVADLFTAR